MNINVRVIDGESHSVGSAPPRSAGNPNVWIGTIPDEETIEWFVQALDGVGNVAINDNKGAYLDLPANRVWLPFISQ